MGDVPPLVAIESALNFARIGRHREGGCVKSNRGAAIFDPNRRDARGRSMIDGVGYNSPPLGLRCEATDVCRKTCGMRCMHAEQRAILHAQASWPIRLRLELVHVKLGDDDKLVVSGPPSCVQCSRMILDVGWIVGVWLYEVCKHTSCTHDDPGVWVRYDPLEFHRLSMVNSKLTS